MKNELFRFGNQFPLVAANFIQEDINGIFGALQLELKSWILEYKLYVGPNEIILRLLAPDHIPELDGIDFIRIITKILSLEDVDVASFNFSELDENGENNDYFMIYRYQILFTQP